MEGSVEGGNVPLSSSPEQDRPMPVISGFPRPDGLGRTRQHEGDAQDWIPSLHDLWQMMEEMFPGYMNRLLKIFEGSIDKKNLESTANGMHVNKNPDTNHDDGNKMDIDKGTIDEGSSRKDKGKAALEPRRSLLKKVKGSLADLRYITEALNERAKGAYTEAITPVFLLELDDELRYTEGLAGQFDATYVNLRTITVDENKGKTTDQKTSTKYLLENTQALELALLFNELLGEPFIEDLDVKRMDAYTLSTSFAANKNGVAHMFSGVRDTFDDIFGVFENFGLYVTARDKGQANGHSLPTRGRSDLSVKISGTNRDEDEDEIVSEFPVIIEFKKPNAGFWVGWTLLAGHAWTKEQKQAFWELKSVPRRDNMRKGLKDWENAKMWDSIKEVLNKVPPNRVHAEYSHKSAKNSEGIDDPAKPVLSKNSGETGNPATPTRSHFIGGNKEDITGLLESAQSKVCIDNCLDALGKVAQYARGSNCDKIAIADGLTFIAGTLENVVHCTGASNPDEREDVLDVNFHSTSMIQTHDKNSSLSFLNYLCNNAMTSRVLCAGYSLFLLARDLYPGDPATNEITEELQEKLREKVNNQGRLVFDSKHHCLAIPGIEGSARPESKIQRAIILETLGEVKLAKSPDHFTSRDFIICEWFRENIYQGASSGPFCGRSKSVARVQLRSESDGKNYVLKEYYGDEDSMAKARLELDAYELMAKLDANDKKYVAELVAFGSLDLDGANPRLFLLLEYVEEHENAPDDKAALWKELYYVDDVLISVGVSHNDLEDRNYKWQQDADGSWYIKVFDFDHAKLHEPTKTQC